MNPRSSALLVAFGLAPLAVYAGSRKSDLPEWLRALLVVGGIGAGLWGIWMLQHPDMIPGGLAEGMLPSEFDAKSLREGTLVELEHTTDPRIAQEIAMDHLTERGDYYQRLRVVEG